MVRFVLAVGASGVATSFTDWLFMGKLFHRKYFETPEIWRIKPGQSDTRSIVASSLLGVLSCAAFIWLARWTDAMTVRSELHMAELVWVAGPLPVIFSNIVWIKMNPLLGISHSLGWFARFAISGLIGGWLLK
ncbi:MAG: DUF1761 domain-containing protein [Candidatus Acidiferrum sp.]|jgi:hypothetical protein